MTETYIARECPHCHRISPKNGGQLFCIKNSCVVTDVNQCRIRDAFIAEFKYKEISKITHKVAIEWWHDDHKSDDFITQEELECENKRIAEWEEDQNLKRKEDKEHV